MLGIDWIARIGSLVERRFDHQIADLVGRRRAPNRSVAFDDQRLAAGAGEQRRSGQAAEARPDDDDVVSLHHLMHFLVAEERIRRNHPFLKIEV